MRTKSVLTFPAMLLIGFAVYFYMNVNKAYKLPTTTNEMDECTLLRVVDGDTIEVQRDSENIIVRLIGIDAPESVNPNPELNTAEGEAASSYVQELLEDIDVVYLEYDFQIRDSYDRTLAYVWYYDDQELRMLNLQLVEDDIAIPINGSINQRYRRFFNNASS